MKPLLNRRLVCLTILVCCLAALWSPAPCHAQATGPKSTTVDSAPSLKAQQLSDWSARSDGQPSRFELLQDDREQRIERLLEEMTLEEKVGQLVQLFPEDGKLSDEVAERIRQGRIGSVFFPGEGAPVRKAQRIAREESRLGVPLVIARDVIHGFRTIFPIPLAQAATWNPDLVEAAASVSAREAMSEGIDWTFAPMVDVCRDARWGRIAETVGEDPYLASQFAAAMVRGFQMEQGGDIQGVAACAKHFVGYGLSEGGRDYNRVSVSTADLHNILLPPFRASIDAGCHTLMTSFSEINGVPGTAHSDLLRGVLKRDWGFQGIVVSDWGSIGEMVEHGFAKNKLHATKLSVMAGVDMDMCNDVFEVHLAKLVREGRIPEERLDDAVRRVLRTKFSLAGRDSKNLQFEPLQESSLDLARTAARESVVLLKNQGELPLRLEALKRVAVIGPLADAPQQQLGCWTLDAAVEASVTPLADLRRRLAGKVEVLYAPGAPNSFSADDSLIPEAVAAASKADVALMFIGEDAVLSGEARCRTSLALPGVQSRLVKAVADTGVPTVLVFLAGRPLTIGEEVDTAGAVMFAWHPGTMAGPAITDLLLGEASPSGKLPVTFPRSVGQTPIYYSRSNTGRPSPADYRPLVGSGKDDLPEEFQYRSHYLDELPGPLFPFGFGLSYGKFEYSSIAADTSTIRPDQDITLTAVVANTGDRSAVEVAQLYVQDKYARVVRPVRELKAFRRVKLAPGESETVSFQLAAEDLRFFNNAGKLVLEPGAFRAWIGGDSDAEMGIDFELLPRQDKQVRNALNPIPATSGQAPPSR